MEALSMLAPSERCVRGKLQLFLRLWVARQKYESLKPFGTTPAKRIRFHLEQLYGCWNHVVEFQKTVALEVEHFTPSDKFELIYVISAFVNRELNDKENALIGVQAKWSAYQQALRRLRFEVNRYDFADACARCHQIIGDMAIAEGPGAAEIIPFTRRGKAQIDGVALKMREEAFIEQVR
jgi:hypothetical protein